MTELLYTKIEVFGFHGCNKKVKEHILDKKAAFWQSTNEYDWLGDGIYFWENDYLRAKEWASFKNKDQAAVIGAKINLGSCYDLSNQFAREMLKVAYAGLANEYTSSGLVVPKNLNPKRFSGNPNDMVLRYLDRAVLEYFFKVYENSTKGIKFDTVRAPFQEGYELYPGSGFREFDHIQLCVRNPDRLVELFDPE